MVRTTTSCLIFLAAFVQGCIEIPAPPATCTDRAKNGSESDIDCGGDQCAQCEAEGVCLLNSDCLSGQCDGGRCAGTCDDGLKNGDETGVDCGGGQCSLCSAGGACTDSNQCASQRCVDGECLGIACEDGVMNGTETDVDCGGECETKCPLNSGCRYATDCATGGACVDIQNDRGTCAAPSCDDGLRNQDEVDVDCAGQCAQGCLSGNRCGRDGDCADGLICSSNQCVLASCRNEVQNDSETAVDCGGVDCAPCVAQMRCLEARDCADGLSCVPLTEFNYCMPESCRDDVENGFETDVDCGGLECAPCQVGEICRVPNDCRDQVCLAADGTALPEDNETEVRGMCAESACMDGLLNGEESGTDCGGPTCPNRCMPGQSCWLDTDCAPGFICDGVQSPNRGVCAPGGS